MNGTSEFVFDYINSRKDDLKKKITGIIEKVIYGYIKDGADETEINNIYNQEIIQEFKKKSVNGEDRIIING